MKLYVAGPMTGIAKLNYPHFVEVEDRLRAHGFEVLNPARVDEYEPKVCGHSPEEKHEWCPQCVERDWKWYMRKCIVMLMAAEGVALLRGWERSKGASVEYDIAVALGMRPAPWQTWVLEHAKAEERRAKQEGEKA